MNVAKSNKYSNFIIKSITKKLILFLPYILCFIQLICESDINEWPVCDIFLAWHSSGFPLDKARDYAEKYTPIIFNDLQS